MKVIFGLGNPEAKYTGTRHNVGFWATAALADQWGGVFKQQSKHTALVADVMVANEKVLIVQPQTYYNDVGQSARSIMDFYKLTPADFLVIHDDLALPLGTIRTRIGGSSGGNNGLKSLESHLGPATARVRVGVWDQSHTTKDNVSIVLGTFTRTETDLLTTELPTITAIATDFVRDAFSVTTYK